MSPTAEYLLHSPRCFRSQGTHASHTALLSTVMHITEKMRLTANCTSKSRNWGDKRIPEQVVTSKSRDLSAKIYCRGLSNTAYSKSNQNSCQWSEVLQMRGMPCAEVSRNSTPSQHAYVIRKLLVQLEAVVHFLLLPHCSFCRPAAGAQQQGNHLHVTKLLTQGSDNTTQVCSALFMYRHSILRFVSPY